MILDPISLHKIPTEKTKYEIQSVQCGQVGGVRRARDVASHPRLACPMLQLCHATMHYAPCSNYAVHNYALCPMLQLCHATMHGTPCFNYTGPLTMQLALQAGTFHNMHCTLCSHYAMQLCTAPCVIFFRYFAENTVLICVILYSAIELISINQLQASFVHITPPY